MPKKHGDVMRAFRAALPVTLPVLAAYGFIGFSYGIYMSSLGFAAWVPFVLALVIYGGSLEFLMGAFLLSPFAPLPVFLVSLMVQGRHLFYGIAMLDRFKGTGWKKPYLIYALTDETFAVTYTARVPEGVNPKWHQFWVSLLNQSYWAFAALIGGLVGGSLPFDLTGIDFVMTAMFLCIFLDQAFKETKHYTALIGFVASIGALLVFGADAFMIPAMVGIVVLLMLFRKPLERAGGFAQ